MAPKLQSYLIRWNNHVHKFKIKWCTDSSASEKYMHEIVNVAEEILRSKTLPVEMESKNLFILTKICYWSHLSKVRSLRHFRREYSGYLTAGKHSVLLTVFLKQDGKKSQCSENTISKSSKEGEMSDADSGNSAATDSEMKLIVLKDAEKKVTAGSDQLLEHNVPEDLFSSFSREEFPESSDYFQISCDGLDLENAKENSLNTSNETNYDCSIYNTLVDLLVNDNDLNMEGKNHNIHEIKCFDGNEAINVIGNELCHEFSNCHELSDLFEDNVQSIENTECVSDTSAADQERYVPVAENRSRTIEECTNSVSMMIESSASCFDCSNDIPEKCNIEGECASANFAETRSTSGSVVPTLREAESLTNPYSQSLHARNTSTDDSFEGCKIPNDRRKNDSHPKEKQLKQSRVNRSLPVTVELGSSEFCLPECVFTEISSPCEGVEDIENLLLTHLSSQKSKNTINIGGIALTPCQNRVRAEKSDFLVTSSSKNLISRKNAMSTVQKPHRSCISAKLHLMKQNTKQEYLASVAYIRNHSYLDKVDSLFTNHRANLLPDTLIDVISLSNNSKPKLVWEHTSQSGVIFSTEVQTKKNAVCGIDKIVAATNISTPNSSLQSCENIRITGYLAPEQTKGTPEPCTSRSYRSKKFSCSQFHIFPSVFGKSEGISQSYRYKNESSKSETSITEITSPPDKISEKIPLLTGKQICCSSTASSTNEKSLRKTSSDPNKSKICTSKRFTDSMHAKLQSDSLQNGLLQCSQSSKSEILKPKTKSASSSLGKKHSHFKPAKTLSREHTHCLESDKCRNKVPSEKIPAFSQETSFARSHEHFLVGERSLENEKPSVSSIAKVSLKSSHLINSDTLDSTNVPVSPVLTHEDLHSEPTVSNHQMHPKSLNTERNLKRDVAISDTCSENIISVSQSPSLTHKSLRLTRSKSLNSLPLEGETPSLPEVSETCLSISGMHESSFSPNTNSAGMRITCSTHKKKKRSRSESGASDIHNEKILANDDVKFKNNNVPNTVVSVANLPQSKRTSQRSCYTKFKELQNISFPKKSLGNSECEITSKQTVPRSQPLEHLNLQHKQNRSAFVQCSKSLNSVVPVSKAISISQQKSKRNSLFQTGPVRNSQAKNTSESIITHSFINYDSFHIKPVSVRLVRSEYLDRLASQSQATFQKSYFLDDEAPVRISKVTNPTAKHSVRIKRKRNCESCPASHIDNRKKLKCSATALNCENSFELETEVSETSERDGSVRSKTDSFPHSVPVPDNYQGRDSVFEDMCGSAAVPHISKNFEFRYVNFSPSLDPLGIYSEDEKLRFSSKGQGLIESRTTFIPSEHPSAGSYDSSIPHAVCSCSVRRAINLGICPASIKRSPSKRSTKSSLKSRLRRPSWSDIDRCEKCHIFHYGFTTVNYESVLKKYFNALLKYEKKYEDIRGFLKGLWRYLKLPGCGRMLQIFVYMPLQRHKCPYCRLDAFAELCLGCSNLFERDELGFYVPFT